VQGRKRNFVPSGCARPRVGGKVRAVTCFGGPSLPGIVYVGTQVVLSGVVPFRIGKARADAAVQALPEIAGGFVNKHDLLSFEGYFLPRGLQNFNLRGTSAQRFRSRECSCLDCSILSPNEEKLLALNMVDF